MPIAPAKPCRRCRHKLTRDPSGLCEACRAKAAIGKRQAAKQADRLRGSAASRGYDATWRKARAEYLREHPLCVSCLERGRLTPATLVDHIEPHRGDPELFWDYENNWQSLCKRCHDRKTASGR